MEKSIVAEYLDKIKFSLEKLNNDVKIGYSGTIKNAFRGESRDYGETRLMPTIFRNNNNLKTEQYLFELLEDYNIIDCNKVRNIEKAIEAQHYVEISRLLDITFNILPALYFACKSNKKADGIIYVFAFPEHYSPHSQYLESIYTKLLKDESILYEKNFRVVTHSRYNERIIAQNGGFIFFPGDMFSPIRDIYYKNIRIESKDKDSILSELKYYFGIDERYLFPGKQGDIEYIKKEIENYNVKKNEELSIENEVKMYFNRFEYECKIMKREYEKVRYERVLRKEMLDIKQYVYEKKLEEKREKRIISDIEERFNILMI